MSGSTFLGAFGLPANQGTKGRLMKADFSISQNELEILITLIGAEITRTKIQISKLQNNFNSIAEVRFAIEYLDSLTVLLNKFG